MRRAAPLSCRHLRMAASSGGRKPSGLTEQALIKNISHLFRVLSTVYMASKPMLSTRTYSHYLSQGFLLGILSILPRHPLSPARDPNESAFLVGRHVTEQALIKNISHLFRVTRKDQPT